LGWPFLLGLASFGRRVSPFELRSFSGKKDGFEPYTRLYSDNILISSCWDKENFASLQDMVLASKFTTFLAQLGYRVTSTDMEVGVFRTSLLDQTTGAIKVEFVACESHLNLQQQYLRRWNRGDQVPFIAVLESNTLVIDPRRKPSPNVETIETIETIDSFDYGYNDSVLNEEIKNKLGTDGIGFQFLANYVIARNLEVKDTIDRDLLANLLVLKKDLVSLGKIPDAKAQLLLLRCLFVKYLEDRGILDTDGLLTAIESSNVGNVFEVFGKVDGLNGDLFKGDTLVEGDLNPVVVSRLKKFFGCYDYRSGQGKLFPYLFDCIPITLIGNIYESFLSDDDKAAHGVYYTPRHLTQFVVSLGFNGDEGANLGATILDPACGSGAFLVEAFSQLIDRNHARNSLDRKIVILKNQVFGIDLDERAIRIATFSLYLELLRGEDKELVRAKIDAREPIFPNLFNRTLIPANAILECPKFMQGDGTVVSCFDFIFGNPPWGRETDKVVRLAMEGKDQNRKRYKGFEIYKNAIGEYEKSQAFLLKAQVWSHSNTMVSMVVRSSNFFDTEDDNFRRVLLRTYHLQMIHMLTQVNDIVFKKKKLPLSPNYDPLDLGANEPCAVVFMKLGPVETDRVNYVRPRHSRLSQHLKLIVHCSSDVVVADQADFSKEDKLWSVFALGSWSDFQLIQKRINRRNPHVNIICRSGIKQKRISKGREKPEEDLWPIVSGPDVYRWRSEWSDLDEIDRNEPKDRDRKDDSIFRGPRILVKRRISNYKDGHLTFAYIETDALHYDSCHSIKLVQTGTVLGYDLLLGILNSRLATYFFFLLSSELGKSDGAKYERIQTSLPENFPIPVLEGKEEIVAKIVTKVGEIQTNSNLGFDVTGLEVDIDKMVYELYDLRPFERKIVEDFFAVNFGELKLVDDSQMQLFPLSEDKRQKYHVVKRDQVMDGDLEKYAAQFEKTMGLMIHKDTVVHHDFKVFEPYCAIICFSFGDAASPVELHDLAALLKSQKIRQKLSSTLLNGEKTKWYDKEKQRLFIMKSDRFRDWTERRANEDANEEIAEMIRHLETNG
jgi:16S rRNA G966 N2-methylase RsmD